jgi:hypothetical protein
MVAAACKKVERQRTGYATGKRNAKLPVQIERID